MTFWLYDYVGTGPYRVRSWDPSNLAVLEANSDYVLGRPKIDDPRPAVIADVQLRSALLHAIDRRNIADTLGGGVGPVAHSYLNLGQPEYREIEAQLPRYEYDPRRAAQLLSGLGYSRGAILRQAQDRLFATRRASG